jgi:hypothetical protein
VVAGTISGGSRHGPKLRGICVQAQPASPADQIPFELIQATSDRGGRYRVAGLATGKFQFSFYPGCGGGSGYIGLAYPSAVLVTAGRTTRVNPTLPPQSTISGTATGPGGRPVAGICVFAVGRESFGKATTSRRGRYAIGGLSAGQYEVDFAGGCGSSGSYAPTAYGGSRRPASVPVGRGEHVTGINAAMRPGATITGKVTDRSRRPIETCLQTTARSTYVGDGLTPQGLNPDSFVYDTAAGGSSADGSYRIANLLPGVYNIAFNNCNGGGAPLRRRVVPSSRPVGRRRPRVGRRARRTPGQGERHAAGRWLDQRRNQVGRGQAARRHLLLPRRRGRSGAFRRLSADVGRSADRV